MKALRDSIETVIPPIHREGYKFIAVFAAVTLLLWAFSELLGVMGLLLTAWCIYFFRDPERVTPTDASLVISPASGRVLTVTTALPPPEIGEGEEPWQKISIFMSPFDVHVNRMPASGMVKRVAYRAGKFVNASFDKASDDNERNTILVEREDGKKIIVTQVAGFIARRIIAWVNEGQKLQAGERYGMIRFGSRADIYLPNDFEVTVLAGQTSIAGETVLAKSR